MSALGSEPAVEPDDAWTLRATQIQAYRRSGALMQAYRRSRTLKITLTIRGNNPACRR